MHPLLDRRRFLSHTATGLGGIALAHLLGRDRAFAGGPPIRPDINPANPNAPRAPHFPARAKRVLMIFCSGAVSQVDTFDYKPELIKRHGTRTVRAKTSSPPASRLMDFPASARGRRMRWGARTTRFRLTSRSPIRAARRSRRAIFGGRGFCRRRFKAPISTPPSRSGISRGRRSFLRRRTRRRATSSAR